jgi:hypothetical protein
MCSAAVLYIWGKKKGRNEGAEAEAEELREKSALLTAARM